MHRRAYTYSCVLCCQNNVLSELQPVVAALSMSCLSFRATFFNPGHRCDSILLFNLPLFPLALGGSYGIMDSCSGIRS